MITSEISVHWKVPEIVFIFESHEKLYDMVLENTGYTDQFLPRDAMHPRYQPWACVRVCLSVCHKSVFY